MEVDILPGGLVARIRGHPVPVLLGDLHIEQRRIPVGLSLRKGRRGYSQNLEVIESRIRHALVHQDVGCIDLKPQERAAVDPIEGQ